MTIPAKTSELCLEIRLAARTGDATELETSDGRIFRQEAGDLSDRWSTAALWEAIEASWHERRGIISQAGAVLGEWLFSEAAAEYLQGRIREHSDTEAKLRIELRVPTELAEFPWEIAGIPGIQHLAIHPDLTVVRVSDRGEQQLSPLTGQVRIDVIGVRLEPGGEWSPLATAEEVEKVRLMIENASRRGLYSVEIDVLGDWDVLLDHYEAKPRGRSEPIGPPQVFHFAGHGLPAGRGLVFRGVDGSGRKVAAEQVAHLLRKGRRTRLAFFNACTSAAADHGPYQPFGGLADQLIHQGIPMVVGLQTPVGDTEARYLAETFYAALARGDAVDCALQEAREKLFVRGTGGVGWAFLSLRTSGVPTPLCTLPRAAARSGVDKVFQSFGHDAQRSRLLQLVNREDPTVIVVHGEEHRGHRHVLNRLKDDLERAGNFLWKPVTELRLSERGNLLVQRDQLVGGIARALNLEDVGNRVELENRIAVEIAERTKAKVLVIELVEIISFHDAKASRSLMALITDLWGGLMERAAAHRRPLPVFLLIAVDYPRPLPDDNEKAWKASEIRGITERTVAELRKKRHIEGNTLVEILAPLEPFDETYVADFLEVALSLSHGEAERVAANLVGLHDNETILGRLRVYLEEVKT
ncbi:MAG: CHAT domain-containing protein [bacterium]|nr:CHAT domain-containing protein [bacterium]